MKYFLTCCILALVFYSCDSSKSTMNGKSDSTAVVNDTIRIANDSLEYEILIFEPGFNSWLITQQPKGFYGLTRLESNNRIFVSVYNQRVYDLSYSNRLYPQTINYDPTIEYGLEVNYMLYNYFKFFEDRYDQKLR